MASPFSQNDPEEDKAYKKMIVSCIAAASLVVLLFLVVLYMNTDKKSTARENQVKEEHAVEDDFEYGNSNLKSSDLDFWDMYEDDDETVGEEEEDGDEDQPYKKGGDDKKKSDDEEKESLNKDPDKDPSSRDEADNDENHLAVTGSDGETVYYEILENVKKNNYDLSSPLDSDAKGRLVYKSENKNAVNGIDLSQSNGTVDFAKVKADDISFVMLRIGSRGYSSGTINLDEKFVEYANAAKAANLYIGIYFASSATTEQEASEEASYAVGAIKDFGIRYPIAMDLDSSTDESKRTDSLTMAERTKLVKTFCDTVKQYGYNPVVRASRDTLISKLNLEDLTDVDVWISDVNNPTDYPYAFTMWQYAKDGRVDGIDGDVRMDLSFVSYEEK